MFEHLKLFLQVVGLEHGDVEQHAGLRWKSMSTAADLRSGKNLLFSCKRMENLSGFMNLLCCLTTSRPTESEAAGAQNKTSRRCRTRSQQIQQKPNLGESQPEQDHLAQRPVCQSISVSPNKTNH